MDEMNVTAVAEESAPQDEAVSGATEEAADTAEQSTTSEQPDGEATGEQENTETDLEQSGTASDGDQSAPFLSVRYNHETKDLSQDEARTFVQKGMQAEPIMAELRLLAAQDGADSINTFLKKLKDGYDGRLREQIMGQLSDGSDSELFETLLKARSEKLKAAAGIIEESESKALAAEYDSENARLADEFVSLSKEFPDLKEIKDVPDAVFKLAAKEKISLLDAQLRFNHNENKKIKQAEQSAAAAAGSSAGSAVSSDSDSISPEIAAMRKGVWH